MHIKSLLIGSAAALFSVSASQAADAYIAAEPEPLEYVRICDAFGERYFYIPGTETCLKIGGYVRFQVDWNRGRTSPAANGSTSTTTTAWGGLSDWDAFTRAQLEFDIRSDSELGTVRGFMGLRGDADNNGSSGVGVHQAFIEVGGFRAGKFLNWWDDGLSGEADSLSSNANFNSIRYIFNPGGISFGVSVDELENLGIGNYRRQRYTVVGDEITLSDPGQQEWDNNVGISASLSAQFAGVRMDLVGGYDTDREDGAIRSIFRADFGVGSLGLAALWASGPNAYYGQSEWAIAAEYAFQLNERLKITPGAQWFGNVDQNVATNGVFNTTSRTWTTAIQRSTTLVSDEWSNNDAWLAGVTLDYAITSGLSSKLAVNYYDEEGTSTGSQWTGFVRLDRSF